MAKKLEIEVLQVLPGNRAIVSTKGLCRVVHQPYGEVFEELMSYDRAHVVCHDAELEKARGKDWFEAIDYATGQVIEFDNRGLSKNWERRLYQVFAAPHVGQPRRRRLFASDRKYRVPGFRLGRLLRAPRAKSRVG